MSFDPTKTYRSVLDIDGNIFAYQSGWYYDRYGNRFLTLPVNKEGYAPPTDVEITPDFLGDTLVINSDATGTGADWKYTIARPTVGMTAAQTFTLPTTGGTAARTQDKLSAFAATTSAELAGVISDEEGTSGGFVRATGAALAPASINGVTTDSTTNKPVTAASLAGGTLPASVTTLSATADSIVLNSDATEAAADWKLTIQRPAAGMTVDATFTLPTASGNAARVEDKLSVFAATTSAELAGVISDEEGTSGGFVRATGCALAPTSINGVTTDSTTNKPVTAASLAGWTLPASVTTLSATADSLLLNSDATEAAADWKYTIQRPAAGMTADATLTLPATSGTAARVEDKLSVFAATTSAELAGVISDETGSGSLVFATSPQFSGTLGLGTAATTNIGLRLSTGTVLTGATQATGISANFTYDSGVTTGINYQSINTANASTLTSFTHFACSNLTLSNGATCATQTAFRSANLTIGSTNIGFESQLTSGASKWNFYASGNADNAYAGNSRFGSVVAPVATVDVTGTIAASTSISTINSIVASTTANSAGGISRILAEATATLSGASTVITLSIPTGVRLLGAQLRVDTAVTSGDGATSWAAAYSGGSTTALATGQAFTKNTKANKMHVDEITTNTTNITITPNSNTFSGGVIRAIVYYEDFIAMGDNP